VSPARRAGRGHAAPRRLVHGTTPSGPGLTPAQYTAFQAANTPENVFQEWIRHDALQLGLLYFHDHDSRRNYGGFLDTVLVSPIYPDGTARMMWRELKTTTGRVTRDQREWMDRLRACGHDVDVWRTEDYHSGRVARELAALRYGDRAAGGAR
jgi:hypothetical protein